MIVIFILGTLCVFITYLSDKGLIKGGLEISFILIALVSAIRYNYGNDYTSYSEMFDSYSQLSLFTAIDSSRTEVGWVTLCWLFSGLSFQIMVAVLTIFESVIFYLLIKNNVEIGKRWLALFLYVFTPNLFLVEMSMMRQALAISIILLSVPYIVKQKIIPAAILVLIAVSFHTSALIFVPFIFIGYLSERFYLYFWLSIFVITIVIYINSAYMENILSLLFSSNETIEFYDVYTSGNTIDVAKLGLGSLMSIFLIILSCFSIKKQSSQNMIIILLLSISLLFLPFVEIGVTIRRLGYFFDVFMIVAYPMMINSFRSKFISNSLILVVVIFTVLQFFGFFYNEIWTESYMTFTTIFSK
jgi:hypothetical protein